MYRNVAKKTILTILVVAMIVPMLLMTVANAEGSQSSSFGHCNYLVFKADSKVFIWTSKSLSPDEKSMVWGIACAKALAKGWSFDRHYFITGSQFNPFSAGYTVNAQYNFSFGFSYENGTISFTYEGIGSFFFGGFWTWPTWCTTPAISTTPAETLPNESTLPTQCTTPSWCTWPTWPTCPTWTWTWCTTTTEATTPAATTTTDPTTTNTVISTTSNNPKTGGGSSILWIVAVSAGAILVLAALFVPKKVK